MDTIKISDYELQRGKPMPSKLHSIIQNNLGFILNLNYRNKYQFLSELSIEIDGWSSVPDIAIYPKMEIDYLHDEIHVTEVPLCTIEILSPTQSLNDLTSKVEKYFQAGVKSCWLVIPGFKNIYVFTTPDSYKIFTSDQMLEDEQLNISFSLAEVFK